MTLLAPMAAAATLSGDDPWQAALLSPEPVALAIITGVTGPSYRPLGAAMCVTASGKRTGMLSSGCIDGDVAGHACRLLAGSGERVLRYGAGSRWMDLQLPCGGGLEITLVPRPDVGFLAEIEARRAGRNSFALSLTPEGELRMAEPRCEGFEILFRPEIRVLIFGKGPEAVVFAHLLRSGGFPHLLLSPDEETREAVSVQGSLVRSLPRPHLPRDIELDGRTAVVLLFHDHDWEPPILRDVLATPAFYIGAQGSRRAAANRAAFLGEMGLSEEEIARVKGPIGLISSARDPRTLAISVLAEVMAQGR